MPLLRVENVFKSFGGVMALSDISLEVEEKEIRAIIGPNGAGKTTLINVINRVYPADRGHIYFGEHDITHVSTHKIAPAGIARTFQNIALFKSMTVLENLMLGRHHIMKPSLFSSAIYWGLAQKKEARHRKVIEEIIDFLGIADIRKRIAGTVSYGLQKRVELGRALASESKLLLLDEPMTGMNLEEKEDMARFVLDINEELGKTVILIEHDMGVIMDISHKVSVLEYGIKIAEGNPDEVRSNPLVIKAYLGEAEQVNTLTPTLSP